MTIRYRELPSLQPVHANRRPDYELDGSYLHSLIKEQGACTQDEQSSRIHQDFIEQFAFRPKSKRAKNLEIAAKAICDVCVVKEECLQFALPGHQAYPFAVMGGLNPMELTAEAERLQIQPIKRHRWRVTRLLDVD